MQEITMTYLGLAAVCGVWFLVGYCFGAHVQEKWGRGDGGDGKKEGGAE